MEEQSRRKANYSSSHPVAEGFVPGAYSHLFLKKAKREHQADRTAKDFASFGFT
jgi:hypothetical protein